jgi:hypothetical protein
MLWIHQGHAVNEVLLHEIARTNVMVDPVLFCYGVYLLVALLVFTAAYLVHTWRGRRAKRVVRTRLHVRAAMFSRL